MFEVCSHTVIGRPEGTGRKENDDIIVEHRSTCTMEL